MGKMECYVIEDLLPLYVEELCSPETRQEVEGHLEECVACREKLEQMKQADEGAGSGEPVGIQDIRPFQKISRKMKHNRTVKVAALILLVIVCSVFGVLSVGQCFPGLDCPNYDSILYRFKSKEIARKLVAGDKDEIREVLSGLGTDYGSDSEIMDDERKTLTDDVVDHLAENWTAFGKGDVSVSVKDISYSEYFEGEVERAYYVAQLGIRSGDKEIYMDIRFYNRNQYDIYMHMRTEEVWRDFVKEGVDEDSLEYQVIDINKYLEYYLYSCFGERIENRLLNGRISAQNAETLEGNTSLDGAWFAYYLTEDCMKPGVEKEGAGCTEYSQRTGQRIYEILERCQSNRFQMTDQQYNETEKKFNATLYWEITDLNGNKCNMTKSFYFGPSGYEPADAAVTIHADVGFDEDLVKKMEVLFE